MEVIFNLGDGKWQRNVDHQFFTTPPIELWGQITRPLAIRSIGKNCMMGVRFHTYSAAFFFKENVSELNDQIHDGADVFGMSISVHHQQLLDTDNLEKRIHYLETYFLKKLSEADKRHDKIEFIGHIVNDLKSNVNDKVMHTALRANVSTRYMNMLFTQYTGLQPKLFCKIGRFKNSLSMVHGNEEKLTNVAYAAGYFDQSHFIREFRQFTGMTPNTFASNASPINQLLANP